MSVSVSVTNRPITFDPEDYFEACLPESAGPGESLVRSGFFDHGLVCKTAGHTPLAPSRLPTSVHGSQLSLLGGGGPQQQTPCPGVTASLSMP